MRASRVRRLLFHPLLLSGCCCSVLVIEQQQRVAHKEAKDNAEAALTHLFVDVHVSLPM